MESVFLAKLKMFSNCKHSHGNRQTKVPNLNFVTEKLWT